MTTKAGNTLRMRSAHWGYLAVYSVKAGCSPRRKRSRNSSAKRSTGSRSELESGMESPPARSWHTTVHNQCVPLLLVRMIPETGQEQEDVLESFQGPDVALAGRL